MTKIPNTVWPVMVTPFLDNGDVDVGAVAPLVDWYMERGVGGFLANCATSEMIALTLKERTAIIKAIKKHCDTPVAATGFLAYSFEDQVDELKATEDAGADIVVFLTNRIASQEKGTDVWKENVSKLIARADAGTKFGLYEWPGYPGVWKLTDDELDFITKTGRFVYMKDTCCNLEVLARRAKITKNTNMRIYNANSATYLASLRYGYNGFSGIMANFHPEIYVWLAEHFEDDMEKSELVQSFLTVASFGEGRVSPVSAKYHMSKTNVPMGIFSRLRDYRELSALNRYETEQMALLADWVKSLIGLPVKSGNGTWDSHMTIRGYR